MSWLTRFGNALRPRRLDEDLSAEIRDHLERRTADLERQGLAPEQARRQAVRQFGNVVAVREESREARLARGLDGFARDLRGAWRTIRRNPVFALTAVLSLGLAIGANAALYAIVDAAFLRPLPVAVPDQLVALSQFRPAPGGDRGPAAAETFSYPRYEQLREAAGRSARLFLVEPPNRVEVHALDADAPYEDVTMAVVSSEAFEVLGVAPAAGRLFSPDLDRIGSPRGVVVLSYDYWTRRFGADPAMVGRRLAVDGRPLTILGVTRRGFRGVEPGAFVDLWQPVAQIDPSIFTQVDVQLFSIMGRLAPGRTRAALEARLQPAFDYAPSPAERDGRRGTRLRVEDGAAGLSRFRSTFARPLAILAAVAACLLLIACANAAGLLLARGAARAGEMALRMSLGASRGRLVRQLLVEGGLIALLAAGCGWGLARVSAPALVAAVSPRTTPVQLTLALDTRVLAFCAALGALATLLFAAAPAWRTATPGAPAGRAAGAGPASSRLGRLAVGIQVAFAFCLVAGGTGFVASLRHLTSVDTGFDPRGLTATTISTNTPQWSRQLALMWQLQHQVAALPVVQGAATAWWPIFSGARRAQRVALPGQPLSPDAETFYRVSPGYLATLRIPLLDGRDLTEEDNDNEPVATVVNRAFARRYFGTDAVVGREFLRDDGVRHRIVGLSGDQRYGDLRGGPEPIAYMPMKPPRTFTLYVRSTLDSPSVAALLARETRALGLGMTVGAVAPVDTLIGATILRERLLAALGGVLGSLALLLAAVGLFGLLDYAVERRTREIGIRSALGAARWPLGLLVLRESAALVGAGLLAGLAGALMLLHVSRSLLFEIQPADPHVIATALAVFAIVTLAAVFVPLVRALSIDPVRALRQE